MPRRTELEIESANEPDDEALLRAFSILLGLSPYPEPGEDEETPCPEDDLVF